MKLLKNKKFVGIATILLGFVAIVLAIPAIVLYAYPLASGDSASNAMVKAFEKLSVLSAGVSDVKIAMGLGVATMLFGAVAMVWGGVLVFVPKLTFKSMVTSIAAWVMAGVTALSAILAAVALTKGSSKEIKALDEFQEINTFFEDSYKASAGNLAASVYMIAAGITTQTLAATNVDAIVTFDPTAKNLADNLRYGLTYTLGTNVGAAKSYTQNAEKEEDRIYTDMVKGTPKAMFKGIDAAMMGTVDLLWNAMDLMSQGMTHEQAYDAINAVSPISDTIKPVFEMFKKFSDLIFKTMLGDATNEKLDKTTTSLSTVDGAVGFATFINVAAVALGNMNVIKDLASARQVITAGGAFLKATENMKSTDPEYTTEFGKFMGAAGFTLPEEAKKILPIIGMFVKPSNSLVNRLFKYENDFGNEAAAEGLYLYFARITELSSASFYASTDSDKPHADEADWKTFDTVGRVISRALLTASVVDIAPSTGSINLLEKIHGDSGMKEHFKGIYKDSHLNTTTNTINFEEIYKLFK